MRKNFALVVLGVLSFMMMLAGRGEFEVWAKEKALDNSYSSNDRLEEVLKNNTDSLFRKLELDAIERGVEANTIVLLMLLPLIATLVSVLHYIVGLSGYGIFMPTMVAVTFLATGMGPGLLLFGIILCVSLLSNWWLRKLKLHFWPARSINLMLIAMASFGMMAGGVYWQLFDVTKISIFPVLIMILLVEEFVRTQLAKSRREAVQLTVGTLALAMMGSAAMNLEWVQEWVVLHPEVVILMVVVVNVAVGKYTGIRLMEIKRFRRAIRKKK